MKRCLLIILVIFVVLSTNMMIFAEESDDILYEKEDDILYEKEDDNFDEIESEFDTDFTNDEMESRIVNGTGEDIQIEGVFLDYYSTYYFSGLTYNFGDNIAGTCSYTAAAMLLAYYDTYWDDNIIPEHYEKNREHFNKLLSLDKVKNSPGILREPNPGNMDYETYVDLYQNQYFHLKLINIGADEDIDLFDDGVLFPYRVKLLLEYYLYNVVGFSTSELNVDYISGFENVREYAIDKVMQGIPVFVSATSIGEGAHSYIIYDYDENSDELYCHLGGHYNDRKELLTHVAFSTIDYTLFEGAVSISFNSEHSCSNNYVDSVGNTYCSCYFSCHTEHEHEYEACVGAESTHHVYKCGCAAEGNVTLFHNFEYVNITANGHQEVCSDCGYERDVHEHSFQYTNTSDINHNARCSHCGYETTKYHTFECDGTENGLHYEKCVDCEYREIRLSNPQYTQLGEIGHSKECVHCGYEVNDSHVFVQKSDGALGHILTCKYCGQTSGTHEGHLYTDYDDMFSKCKICGYLKRNNGGFTPIIKTKLPNKDEEPE